MINDSIIYTIIISGIEYKLNANIRNNAVIRKINFSLLSFQLKFLNFRAKRGSSAISKKDIRTEPRRITIGFNKTAVKFV